MHGERLLKYRFPADVCELQGLRQQVREVLSAYDESFVEKLVLAVHEAVVNIIEHAYGGAGAGEIVLEILNNGDALVFELTDFARQIDIQRIKPRELSDLKPGGLGTHFMREIMDECEYHHLEGESGNRLRMIKKIG